MTVDSRVVSEVVGDAAQVKGQGQGSTSVLEIEMETQVVLITSESMIHMHHITMHEIIIMPCVEYVYTYKTD